MATPMPELGPCCCRPPGHLQPTPTPTTHQGPHQGQRTALRRPPLPPRQPCRLQHRGLRVAWAHRHPSVQQWKVRSAWQAGRQAGRQSGGSSTHGTDSRFSSSSSSRTRTHAYRAAACTTDAQRLGRVAGRSWCHSGSFMQHVGAYRQSQAVAGQKHAAGSSP
jgi:hypothetical protein